MSVSPFFQEFLQSFNEQSLGLSIVKLNDLAVVAEYAVNRHGVAGLAERLGVPLGSIVVSINGQNLLAFGYERVASCLSAKPRPLVVGFRQLHVVGGPDESRYWQGYLKLRVGPRQWTGRFFILNSNHTLTSYPSRDVAHCTAADVTDVTEATVVYGATLKKLAGKELDEGHSHEGYFAILARGGERLLLRADSDMAMLDWAAALTVLLATEELNLNLGGDGLEPSGTSVAIGGGKSAVLSSSKANAKANALSCVKQGYLWKQGSQIGWSRRWVRLHGEGELKWFSDVPVDAEELCDGHIMTSQTTKVAVMESEEAADVFRDGEGWFPFTITSGTRRVVFRTRSEDTRAAWAHAMQLVIDGLFGDDRPRLINEIEKDKESSLHLRMERPMLIRDDPEAAYSLMIGEEYGHCTLENFRRIAGQSFLPLCDAFTADIVFEALVQESSQEEHAISQRERGGNGSFFSTLLGGMMTSASVSPDDLISRTVASAPLPGLERLKFEPFQRYVNSVFATTGVNNELWDSLRLRLGLHPLETLIHAEERVLSLPQNMPDNWTRAGLLVWADAGTLMLTDRHLLLHQSLTQSLKVVSLKELDEVNEFPLPRGLASLLSSDEGIILQAPVYCVDISGSGTGGTKKDADSSTASGLRLALTGVQHLFSSKKRKIALSQRTAWVMWIREMLMAHRLSLTDESSRAKISTKVRVLLADDDVEGYDVVVARVHLWAGANIIRSRALTAAVSGSCRLTHESRLMLCSRQHMEGAGEASTIVQAFLMSSSVIGDGERNLRADLPLVMRSPRWLSFLASWLARSRELKERKQQEDSVFSAAKFRSEWDLFWELMDPLVEGMEELCHGLVLWKQPVTSAITLWLLLCVGWFDLLHLVLPTLPLLFCALLVVRGSMEGRKKRDPGHSEEGKTDEVPPYSSIGDEESKKGTEDAGGAVRPTDSLLGRVRSMQAKVGNMQAKIHRTNTFLLKMHSLCTWKDPVRTKLFIVCVVATSLVAMFIPGRLTWSALWVFLFSKPIRSPEKNILELLFDDWWRGLPTLSSTHRNWDMERIQTLRESHSRSKKTS